MSRCCRRCRPGGRPRSRAPAPPSSAPRSRPATRSCRCAGFVAQRAPDLIRSNGGGANAILVRGARIVEHRQVRLRLRPERRVCHAVALDGGLWCANLHAQVHSPVRAQADIARAAAATLAWSGAGAALLGGDFNVREPVAPGFERLGGHGVDHVLGHRLRAAGPPQIPDRGGLSDHAPLIVTVLPQAADG